MNSVQIIGRLTHDPRPAEPRNGTTLATLRLAIPGIRDDHPDYVTVKLWGRSAAAALEHLTRGRRVAVEGRLEHSEWIAADGQRAERLAVVADRIEYLDPPSSNGKAPAATAVIRDS